MVSRRSTERGLVASWVLLAMACGGPPNEDATDTDQVAETDDTPTETDVLSVEAQLRARVAELNIEPLPPLPGQDAARVAMGAALFADPLLDDGDAKMSCAACHGAFGPRGRAVALALGGQTDIDQRQVPNLSDVGRVDLPLFWDARVRRGTGGALEITGHVSQSSTDDPLVAAVLQELIEQRETERAWSPTSAVQADAILLPLARRVREVPGYRALFTKAWPGELTITPVHIAEALAAFMRDRFATASTPWDRWLEGRSGAMSENAKRGALWFLGDGGCVSCHAAPWFTDGEVHAIAAPQVGPGAPPHAPEDRGHARTTPSGTGAYAFVTPRLRNVALTPPYTHAGTLFDLPAVVAHHLDPMASLAAFRADRLQPVHAELEGDGQPPTWLPLTSPYASPALAAAAIGPALDPALATPRSLGDDEKQWVVDFLHALTDPTWLQRTTAFPNDVPSGLPVGAFTR